MGIKESRSAGEGLDYELIGKCFANAAMEVVRTAAGFEIYEDKVNAEKNSMSSGQISGMMLLCGERNALLSVTMTQEAASTIVAYMTGFMPEDLGREELCDGAAELANMIAGRAKVDLAKTDCHFSITPPFSIAGEDYSIVYKNRMPRICKKFEADGMEIFLEVSYI